MGSLTKAKIGKEDLYYEAGVFHSTFNRTSSTGGTVSMTGFPDIWRFGTTIVNARDYNSGVLDDVTLNAVTTDNPDTIVYINPGDWVIDADVTIANDVYVMFDPNAVLQIATGITVTFPSPDHIIASSRQQIFELSGTGVAAFTTGGNVFPGWWGATGDGSTNDTVALQAMLTALSASGNTIHFAPGLTYVTDHLKMISKDNTIIHGNGATLKTLATSATQWYSAGAILAIISSENVAIDNLIFDGNRSNLGAGNLGMNFGIAIWPSDTETSAIFSDNGGLTKDSRNIRISGCEFYNTGANAAGVDKFGDGVHCFAADGLIVENCYFENMGRWAVAGGCNFNITIKDNHVYNSTTGTALGSFDMEDEGADSTNGNYSRNLRIIGNRCRGRAAIHVTAKQTATTQGGTYHYMRDLEILDNYIELYQYATYGESGVTINGATITGAGVVTFEGVRINGNKVRQYSGSGDYDYGINVYLQGVDDYSDIVAVNFEIMHNNLSGFDTNGIRVYSTKPPIMDKLKIFHNRVVAGAAKNSAYGIYVYGYQYEDLDISHNYIADVGTGGIYATYGAAGSIGGKINYNIIDEGLATFQAGGVAINANIDIAQVIGNYVGTLTAGVVCNLANVTLVKDNSFNRDINNTTAVATSGTGEDNLMTQTIQAYSMRESGVLKIVAAGTISGANNTKVIKLYFGTSSWTIISAAAGDETDWRIEATIAEDLATNAQNVTWMGLESDGTITSGFETATIDTTSDVTLKLTGECANAGDTITQELLEIQRH